MSLYLNKSCNSLPLNSKNSLFIRYKSSKLAPLAFFFKSSSPLLTTGSSLELIDQTTNVIIHQKKKKTPQKIQLRKIN